jgi:hypothetical protein
MEAILTITAENNINEETNTIISESSVFTIKRPCKSFIQIYDSLIKRKYAMSVSKLLINKHRILLENAKYVILYMLIKPIQMEE